MMKKLFHGRFKRNVGLALTLLLTLNFSPIVYAAFDETIEKAEKFHNTALDYLDSAINLTQVRRLKQEAWDRFGLVVKPYYKTKMEYTSNVFREPSPRRDDVIWHFTPGISAMYMNDIAKVGVAYEADVKVFTKYEENNFIDQRFGATLDLYPMENMYVHASEQLTKEGVRGATIDFETVNYLDNTVSVATGYKWKRWTPEFTYINFLRDFKTSLDAYDYGENIFQFRLYEDIVKDIRTYMGYDLGLIRYQNDATKAADTHKLYVGIEGTVVWDIKAHANIGFYRRIQFNQSRKNHNTVTTHLSFSKRFFNDATTIETGFTRRPTEVAFADRTFTYENYFYVGIKQRVTNKLRLRSNLGVGETAFVGTQALGPQTAERDDDFVSVGVGADYAARKWMIWHIDYRYNNRDSNFTLYDYSENSFAVSLTMPF